MDGFWEQMLNDPTNEFSEEQKQFLVQSRSRVRRNAIIGVIGGFSIPIVLARKRKVSPFRLYATSIISGIAGNGLSQIVTMGYNVSQVKQRSDGSDLTRKIQQSLIRQRAMMQQGMKFPPSSNVPLPDQQQAQLENGNQEASLGGSDKTGTFMSQESSKSAWDRIREKDDLNRTNTKKEKRYSFPSEDENLDAASSNWPKEDATDMRAQTPEDKEFEKQQREFDRLVWGSNSSSSSGDLTS
ncbi:Schizosaccharomyces specific protein [Schizosaccharomyces osmophilus]|uniref:Schizosaccharomyces specific protein n=1 Tax=Schizosaccharomyces osmophilus TaxID=2545709 RepID=A0AAE9WDX1_9SCHI|nr:Schizosaccharomyces specific protein [Schizosaccharomyces osmophilus]WBW73437.1 Schizosaccharomyces specific protein [Schizosaccharomyces osmophilus]